MFVKLEIARSFQFSIERLSLLSLLYIYYLPFCSGRINFYTHPPEQHTLPAHISAEIVKEWGRELDLVCDVM